MSLGEMAVEARLIQVKWKGGAPQWPLSLTTIVDWHDEDRSHCKQVREKGARRHGRFPKSSILNSRDKGESCVGQS